MPFPAANIIARNAARLYDDALLLIENDRFASAVAIAVLAIEEAGKLHIYRWKNQDQNWETHRSFPPRHSDKQAAFAAPFAASVMQQALCEICAKLAGDSWLKARGPSDWEKAQDFLVEGYSVSQHGPSADVRKHAANILNIVSTYVEEKINTHPLACMLYLADGRHIDKVKQEAIYVDVGADGTCLTDPSIITKEQAAFWLHLAEVAIAGISSDENSIEAVIKFQKKYRTKPDEFKVYTASPEDWKAFLEGLPDKSRKKVRQKSTNRRE